MEIKDSNQLALAVNQEPNKELRQKINLFWKWQARPDVDLSVAQLAAFDKLVGLLEWDALHSQDPITWPDIKSERLDLTSPGGPSTTGDEAAAYNGQLVEPTAGYKVPDRETLVTPPLPEPARKTLRRAWGQAVSFALPETRLQYDALQELISPPKIKKDRPASLEVEEVSRELVEMEISDKEEVRIAGVKDPVSFGVDFRHTDVDYRPIKKRALLHLIKHQEDTFDLPILWRNLTGKKCEKANATALGNFFEQFNKVSGKPIFEVILPEGTTTTGLRTKVGVAPAVEIVLVEPVSNLPE